MICDYCKVKINGSYYQSIDEKNIQVCEECGSEMIASTYYDGYYFDPESTDRGEPKAYYTFIEKEEEQ